MITIPDSVAFYWNDTLNRAAINVLAGSSGVPTDLSMQEAERFELAALAARRVRVEYWQLLRELWKATWESAVRAHLPRAKLLTYGEHLAFADEVDALCNPSVDHAWLEKAVCGVFDVPGHGRLFTRAGFVEGDREGQLQFYFWDIKGSTAISNGLDVGSAWGEDGQDRRTTNAGTFTNIREDGRISSDMLATTARSALTKLAEALARD